MHSINNINGLLYLLINNMMDYYTYLLYYTYMKTSKIYLKRVNSGKSWIFNYFGNPKLLDV